MVAVVISPPVTLKVRLSSESLQHAEMIDFAFPANCPGGNNTAFATARTGDSLAMPQQAGAQNCTRWCHLAEWESRLEIRVA
jgi:hypothetical protein